ncbi:MAG: Maltodextrin ABC transporter, substrate-binding protein MdxE [uncultured Rubrobacteraceae bacterium]|uniref:Maltodextrin ABC transporter, substrate-binding protein MdxE n=1 Tax=uncultured Rubrobacteraceae bacterium TaxID=349277 RepID=A0A6J4QEZ6_9ACTN|nr:MAG: Maltodextrin ABC transporter, substrate-binding protein MdxE [uncultured Rubrobacteraceae bacterium]
MNREPLWDERGAVMGKRIDRREFLKLSGAGLAGAALLGVTGCGGGGGNVGGATELTFSFFPDRTGSVQALIDQFNSENEGEIQVTLREMPADSGQHFDQLNTEFQSGEINIDVIGGDVIWPAQFAANGYIADLSDRFPEDERGAFLPATIEAMTYQGGIYGVPWYTDAGMLYYRSDLLEEAGFTQPPRTWDELKEQARAMQERSGTQYGFVFQGADYEGGVVNALEYIWTSGGDVLEGNQEVVVDSPEAQRGLEIERSMIDDGIAPAGITQYKEQEVATIFLGGDAVFMRNVPRMYALASDPNESSISPDQIRITSLPVAEEGLQSYSSLGGWNFFMNANTEDPDAAYEFIRFMSAPEQQKYRAIEGSVLPARQELYEDEELLQQVPVAELGQEAIQNTRPRPVSPFYSDMSLRMAEQFNASLNGEVSPDEALSTLQEELEEIIEQGSQQSA